MTTALRFPKSSTYSKVKTNWVKFTPITSEGARESSILLPMTQNISIRDGASYNTVDMGKIGSAANLGNDVVKASQGQNFTASNYIDSAINTVAGQTSGADASYLGFDMIPAIPDTIKAGASLQAKKVVNPHTNTLFQNVEIRNFSFVFSLIAESSEEANEIQTIVETFRKNLYPKITGGGGAIANFPNTWEIKFYYGTGDSLGSTENKFIPKIHKTFLQSFTSTYNSSTNSFHKDGAPLEVSCSLAFTETKTYAYDTVIDGSDESLF